MQTFGKQEHLCNIPDIDRLFKEGNSFFKHPVKVIWLPASWDGQPDIKVLISVSKRNFRRATDRNHLKRLLRECYRKNKHIAIEGLKGQKCHLAFVYAGKEITDLNSLEPIIIQLLHRLITAYEKTAG